MTSVGVLSPCFPVKGIRLGTAAAAIKRPGRDDVLIIEAQAGSTASAVFTRNAFCAAPVTVAREHLDHAPRWLLVNSGNANAGTGERGLKDALLTCAEIGALAGAEAREVMPFSTGVIGEFLPVDRLVGALPEALANLSEEGWETAARAIMTTDTRPKIASRRFTVGNQSVTVTGIAKGAGMIHPNMATMLAFLGTDAGISRDALQSALKRAVDETFNCITIDGDTSTNDACVLLASGASAALLPGTPDFDSFEQALLEVCQFLSEAIVRDGEGATKLMRIRVEEAHTPEEALQVGRTIALSPLVKTAFFASDPNWGRILAAVGRSGVSDFDIHRVSIFLGDVEIVQGGARAPGYNEEAGAAVMAEEEILVRVRLGRGDSSSTVVTCDFSYDYVRINAEYRT